MQLKKLSLLALVAVLALVGCSSNDGKSSESSAPASESVVASSEVTSSEVASSEEASSEVTSSEVATSVSSSDVESSEVESSEAPASESVSSEETSSVEASSEAPPAGANEDWKEFRFTMNGKEYKFPFAYPELDKEGWVIDVEDPSEYDNHTINPRTRMIGSMPLVHESYPGTKLKLGFLNLGEEPIALKEGLVSALSINTRKPGEGAADVQFAKGITFGDDEAKILAAYGEPEKADDLYRSADGNYVEIDYRYTSPEGADYVYSLRLSNGILIEFNLDFYDR